MCTRVQYINDGKLSYFNCAQPQNTADEPGGDCDTVVDCTDSILPAPCQLVKQDQDEVKVSEPSSCDVLMKSAADQVETALEGEVEDVSVGIGNRLTKSASWFNSLSRRASRKTPLKKRSFPGYRSVEKQESQERGEVGSRDTSRVRLNK